MVRRMYRALARRAASGDTTALEALGRLEVEAREATTVALSRSHVNHGGLYTFGELAQTTGTSRQAVQQRIARGPQFDRTGAPRGQVGYYSA